MLLWRQVILCECRAGPCHQRGVGEGWLLVQDVCLCFGKCEKCHKSFPQSVPILLPLLPPECTQCSCALYSPITPTLWSWSFFFLTMPWHRIIIPCHGSTRGTNKPPSAAQLRKHTATTWGRLSRFVYVSKITILQLFPNRMFLKLIINGLTNTGKFPIDVLTWSINIGRADAFLMYGVLILEPNSIGLI